MQHWNGKVNVYERYVDGQLAERVVLHDGSFEDTRVGLAALDGTNGWQLVGHEWPLPDPEPPVPGAGDEDQADEDEANEPPADTTTAPPPAGRSGKKG